MKLVKFKHDLNDKIKANTKYIIGDQDAKDLFKLDLVEFELLSEDEKEQDTKILQRDELPLNEFKAKTFMAAKKNQDEQLFEEIYAVAQELVNKGILYDANGVLWTYNIEKFCYELVDKTDIQNVVAAKVNIYSALNPLYKVAFENAIKMIGREKAKVICLNADDKYKYAVQFKDTLFEGLSKEMRKVSQNDFVHNAIPFSPKKGETKRIDELFNQWTNGKATQLKDIIAYSCIPNNTQKLIFFYLGPRNSGKSQFMGIIKRFLGEYNCTSTNLGIIADQRQRFELINLRHKLAVFISEIDEKTTYNTAILKRLSGNDDIRGEYKGVTGTVSFRFGGKVHIITNSLPTVEDENDYAYFARTVIIDFPNTFPNSDVEVLDTIPNEEYEYLSNYCIERIKTWFEARKIEITDLEPVDLRAKKYLEKTDYLKAFVDKYCELEPDFEPDTKYRMQMSTFYSLFKEYLLKNGQKEWDNKRIGRNITERFEKQIERHKRRHDDDIIWEYRGIRLKDKQQTLSVAVVADVADVPYLKNHAYRNEYKGPATPATSGTNPDFITQLEAKDTFGSDKFSKLLSDGVYCHYAADVYKLVK